MKALLLYIWQLPQNLLGLLFLLILKGEKKHRYGNIEFYYASVFNGGISLGKYIILDTTAPKSIKHEYGHCCQSRMLGWLYLPIVGLSSLTWCALYSYVPWFRRWSYYDFWTEKWANRLGGVCKDKVLQSPYAYTFVENR